MMYLTRSISSALAKNGGQNSTMMVAMLQRSSASSNVDSRRTKATLPDLPYDYNALEPVISAEIMQLHHSKHHQAYVNNFNLQTEQLQEAKAKNDKAKIVTLESGIHFNGGGHINHSIFWKNLAPVGKGGEPSGNLLKAINDAFGSLEAMKTQMSAQAVGVQGSGWAWLGMCPKSGKLRTVTCANQDPLDKTHGLVPLFGIDVWEHAYYLQYKNVRPDYVNAIWKVANWKDIEQRFSSGKK